MRDAFAFTNLKLLCFGYNCVKNVFCHSKRFVICPYTPHTLEKFMRMFAVFLGLTLMQSIPASAQIVCTFDNKGQCSESALEEPSLQNVAVLEGNGYGSIAGGLWTGTPNRVATGAATGRTAREARDTAIKVCEDRAPVPLTCKEIRTFNNGCWYIANGVRGTQTRYAADITWDRAFDACSQDGFTCRTIQIGACVYDDVEGAEQDE